VQVYCTNKAEVLELVVTFTHDAVLLAKATVLSTYYRDIALTSIQQQLPALLVNAFKQAADYQGCCQVQCCTTFDRLYHRLYHTPCQALFVLIWLQNMMRHAGVFARLTHWRSSLSQ
jgi:hypothetical protein